MSSGIEYRRSNPPVILPRLKRVARRAYVGFLKLKENPREIALGFSLGLLIGMTPFIGAHILTSVTLASMLGWSKISAMVGVNITNVGTAPLIYPVNYWVGVKLLGVSSEIQWPTPFDHGQMLQLIKQSPLILVDLLAGGLILGIPLAIAGYFLALHTVYHYRKRRLLTSSDQ